jgi:ADP-ribose pyrophosphatase YjhB (NUDIX family)
VSAAAVFGILLLEGRVVLVMDRGKRPPHFYKMPGGRAETNESVTEALLRELTEETGLRDFVLREELFHSTIMKGAEQHEFVVYLVSTSEGLGNINPYKDEIALISLVTIPQLFRFLKCGKVLPPNHTEALSFLRWRDKFLPPDLLEAVESPADGDLELHIYIAPTSGVVTGEGETIENVGGFWRARLLPETSQRLRKHLEMLA